ncbi:hypothetical protein E2C01_026394 [Portunus trituberculatus]|uniref:Uncharacterized protein n=1 Tax=Portunus trituberculatus TaxID=210409 RepID=A0A5B7EI15_PORTR|nr:hypothetical protein [Portunus trituberculatus]
MTCCGDEVTYLVWGAGLACAGHSSARPSPEALVSEWILSVDGKRGPELPIGSVPDPTTLTHTHFVCFPSPRPSTPILPPPHTARHTLLNSGSHSTHDFRSLITCCG